MIRMCALTRFFFWLSNRIGRRILLRKLPVRCFVNWDFNRLLYGEASSIVAFMTWSFTTLSADDNPETVIRSGGVLLVIPGQYLDGTTDIQDVLLQDRLEAGKVDFTWPEGTLGIAMVVSLKEQRLQLDILGRRHSGLITRLWPRYRACVGFFWMSMRLRLQSAGCWRSNNLPWSRMVISDEPASTGLASMVSEQKTFACYGGRKRIWHSWIRTLSLCYIGRFTYRSLCLIHRR